MLSGQNWQSSHFYLNQFFSSSATVAAIVRAREFESGDRSPLVSGLNPVAANFAGHSHLCICKFEKEISPSTKS